MLSLSDPLWPRFQANYTDGAGVAGLLRRAERAVTLIAALLTEPQTDQIELRYLLASQAAVKGRPGLAVSIEALDVDPELDDDPLLKDEY
jgi:hypothetical protein